MSKTNNDQLTPSQAAKVIGVSRQQVDNYIRDGLLSCEPIKVGRKVVVRLIKRSDAETFERRNPGPAPIRRKTQVKRKTV